MMRLHPENRYLKESLLIVPTGRSISEVGRLSANTRKKLGLLVLKLPKGLGECPGLIAFKRTPFQRKHLEALLLLRYLFCHCRLPIEYLHHFT
jgi:hypothetical protein